MLFVLFIPQTFFPKSSYFATTDDLDESFSQPFCLRWRGFFRITLCPDSQSFNAAKRIEKLHLLCNVKNLLE
jgi:hypothetical protein